MKLKALLLGSAAALIAVSGARAADAVVAEPEPMEYVKVCDMYGSGFHYIPGTETCMNINGYVRIDYFYNNNDDDQDTDGYVYRARVNLDVRNETDWGTLRSQIRFQSDGNGGHNKLSHFEDDGDAGGTHDDYTAGGDGFVGLDRALISIAGFRMGYSDSFTTTLHGYGLPIEKNDGPYGYDQAIFFDYTYAANGFAATVGVQDSTADHVRFADGGDNTINPDWYAGFKYSGGMFAVAASYIYETDVDDGAWKLSANVQPVDGFSINGWYAGDSCGCTRQVSGAGEYTYGIGASYKVTDTVKLAIGYSDTDDDDASAVVAGVFWDPIPGLSIRPEVIFREDDTSSYNVRVYRTF